MANTAIFKTEGPGSPATICPMPLWPALLYFGLPALLFRLALYNGTPWLRPIS